MISRLPLKTIRRLLLPTAALCLLLGSARAQQQPVEFPAPERLAVSDDPEDLAGRQLVVKWHKPAAADAVTGYRLGGYLVYVGESREGAELSPAQVVPDPQKTETLLSGLLPSKSYIVQVGALYIPEQVTGELIDLNAVAYLRNQGAVEAKSARSGPISPVGALFDPKKTNVLIATMVYCAIVLLAIYFAQRGEMYIRPIPGLEAVNDAIGRATEMGRPILYVSGLSGITDIATIAAMLILGHLAKRTAAYETSIIVPCNDPLVLTAEREIVHQAYIEAGKPEAYEPENIFYVTDSQFGYAAAVDGIMMRERPAANFFMGMFYAESLILAETGNRTGAIQIAGTDADTQLPFFITACDYTLMGEELYAAGAYLSRNPLLVAQLKGQDIGKVLLAAALVVGTALATLSAYLGPDIVKAFLSWFQI